MTQPVFFIGPRGCGKTTVGQALAQEQNWHFVDTDHWLQERAQMNVAEIVAKEGWEGFRARETQALQAVSATSTVVATGGGMVLAEANRRFMREAGLVIYLRAPAGVLAARLDAFPQAGQRPALTAKPPEEEIREVLAEREPLYCETAHYIVDAAQPLERIIADVQAALSQPASGALRLYS
ncbi:shikimate kinase AroL [Superficieibacter electus]|uniref:Shikimate kinase 1 n=1 Tax=Superficieibacter electus TaxID=2022662 RepID=A0A2P5GSB3_9ENTR|nr:shikimate kinase AroL [Superficieibacter electus]POP46709.1 shikimate kinase AroL [Superficieibacter electus]POP49447.1 shikimate kinase AroL [Superficieibacter electus]